MNAIGAGRFARGRPSVRKARRWVATVALCTSSPWVFAQSGTLPFEPAEGGPLPSPYKLEVSASALPRFDGIDGGFDVARVAVSWLPPRRSALGFAATITTHEAGSAGRAAGSVSAFDLGVHWRHTLDNNHRIDVTAWRRLTPPPDALTLVQLRQPSYGARIEMKLAPARASGLVADYGFIGLQLESGARLTLRKKDGRPTLVYRVKF